MRKILVSAIFTCLFIYACDDVIPEIILVEVSGTVVESQSQSPISRASVVIVDQDDLDTLITGNDGKFIFPNLRLDDGNYELWIGHPDYNVETTVFTVENGVQKDDITVSLITSEALDFDAEIMDFGSGETEISLSVTNVSSGTETVNITINADWLEASSDELTLASGGDESVTFTVDRASVEIGSFETNVVFEIDGKPTQTVLVKMQKLDPNSAILTLDANTLDFGKATETRNLKITNTGQESLDWTASSNAAWLSISSESGAIAIGEDATLAVSVDREGLDNGTYESTIDFGGNGGTATLTVQMEVDNSVGLLKLSTTSLDLGIEDVDTQITLTNDGTKELDWEASVNDSWIMLDVSSGNLDIGANATLNISVDRTPLAAGTFEGSIDFVAEGETTTLFIAMEVQGGILEISNTTLNFGSAESSEVLTFSNVGMRSLDWSSTENTSWLNIAPKEGTIGVDAEASVVVEVDRSGLALGDYSSSIMVTSEGTDFTITVSMTVAQDTDGDGVPDEVDADFDGDGLIEVYTINDLNDIRNDLDASGDGKQGAPAGGFTGFELMNDLDFNDDTSYDDLSLKPDVTAGSGWAPLGGSSTSNAFNTIFEGNNFTISNLLINRTSEYNGLFSSTGILSEVKNLRLEIRFLSGGNYTGGLIGLNRGDVINCSVDTGSQTISVGRYSGILIGWMREGYVNRCYTTGAISSSMDQIGGLIGLTNSGGNIVVEFSYSMAKVSGSSYVGGFIGRNGGSGNASVSSCYATGDVSGTSNYIGGLIGSGFAGLNSCYATGNVSTSERYAGGLVGYYSSSGGISSSYSLGSVSGSGFVGGLIGFLQNGDVPASNYWNTETSGLASSASNATGLTTSELQIPTSADGIYITWGSTAWDFGSTSQYPALKDMPNGLEAQRD